jgi:hypothetical protein
MLRIRSLLVTVAVAGFAAPAFAQTVDTAQARFQPPTEIQYLRPQDKRGMNVFETPKVEGVPYTGFKVQWGAAFTQQFQGLRHENDADSLPYAPAGPATNNNRNRLVEIGNGFNNANANMYLHAQLAPGIRVQLTSYLSSRHHNETWVKDGFLQIDASPLDVPIFHSIMQYTTLKIGHFQVNYGDFQFRRSDNGHALYNPFVGNAIMDAFTTEIGTEAVVQRNGFFGVLALTNGEIRGNIKDPSKRSPAVMLKGGFDRQLNEDLRVRLSASYRQQESAISNTLYSGDRAGARYYFVAENTNATEAAQFTSGRVNPGFTDALTAFMVNPFMKWNGVEIFGMYERATGRGQEVAGVAPADRDVTQMMAELVYRFGAGEKFFVGGRYNTVNGQIGQTVVAGTTSFNYFDNATPATFLADEPTITRTNIGGGWFITPSLMLKAEYVTQNYKDFIRSDIRSGAKFSGFMIEAITAF